MKAVQIAVAFILVATINAKKANFTEENRNSYSGDDSNDKLTEKNDGATAENQLIFANKFERANLDGSKGQDRAVEEKTLRDFIPYDALQNVLVNIFKPQQPIVDTPEAKEMNVPSSRKGVEMLGDFIVKGSETLSRAINTVFDVPKTAFNKITLGATQALNNLGAYLVGL